ncbi:MAG TPA: hypothetical protein VHV51_02875 [Polyangiaceae bacterium]|jgi:hypothetical protein|nr:hypothetical protein [Polyangiaceae bacterium]
MRRNPRAERAARVTQTKNEPRKKPPFLPGVLAIAFGVPGIFWLKFGTINGYALAVTGFLLLLVFAIEFIPKLNQKYGAELEADKIEPRWYDKFAIVWLLAIPFAPFLGWAIQSAATIGLQNWRWIFGLRAFVCVVLPLATVLSLLRYVRGRAAPYALLILFVGTAFPVSMGISAALDFIQGARWESIEISSLERVTTMVHNQITPTTIVSVTLSDGRMLEANSDAVALRSGAKRALILNHSSIILALE